MKYVVELEVFGDVDWYADRGHLEEIVTEAVLGDTNNEANAVKAVVHAPEAYIEMVAPKSEDEDEDEDENEDMGVAPRSYIYVVGVQVTGQSILELYEAAEEWHRVNDIAEPWQFSIRGVRSQPNGTLVGDIDVSLVIEDDENEAGKKKVR